MLALPPGSFERSLAHAETALSHYDGVYEDRLTAAFGEHPDVSCQLWAALSTWSLGFPDEAMERAERAVASSTIGARARARAVAQAQAAVVAHLRGDVAATREWSAAAIEAGSQLGFTYWRAMAGVLHGWARAAEGDPDGGLAEIRESIDLSRGLGARMDDAFYLTVLADAARRDRRRTPPSPRSTKPATSQPRGRSSSPPSSSASAARCWRAPRA